MSTQPNEVEPVFDVADRMRKGLREGDVGVQEMADYLDVSRNTVSTWINGRIKPSTQTLRLWALRTGIPYEWLIHGHIGPGNNPDDGLKQSGPDANDDDDAGHVSRG